MNLFDSLVFGIIRFMDSKLCGVVIYSSIIGLFWYRAHHGKGFLGSIGIVIAVFFLLIIPAYVLNGLLKPIETNGYSRGKLVVRVIVRKEKDQNELIKSIHARAKEVIETYKLDADAAEQAIRFLDPATPSPFRSPHAWINQFRFSAISPLIGTNVQDVHPTGYFVGVPHYGWRGGDALGGSTFQKIDASELKPWDVSNIFIFADQPNLKFRYRYYDTDSWKEIPIEGEIGALVRNHGVLFLFGVPTEKPVHF